MTVNLSDAPIQIISLDAEGMTCGPCASRDFEEECAAYFAPPYRVDVTA